MEPITREKVWEGKCTGGVSVGLSKSWQLLWSSGTGLTLKCLQVKEMFLICMLMICWGEKIKLNKRHMEM